MERGFGRQSGFTLEEVKKQVEEARVLKMVPNKRLMLIHFDDQGRSVQMR